LVLLLAADFAIAQAKANPNDSAFGRVHICKSNEWRCWNLQFYW